MDAILQQSQQTEKVDLPEFKFHYKYVYDGVLRKLGAIDKSDLEKVELEAHFVKWAKES